MKNVSPFPGGASGGPSDRGSAKAVRSPFSGPDATTNLAMLIALTARNGVETLHSEGAFSDRQAPALNRRLRGRIFEFLTALERSDPDQDDEPFVAYLRELAGNDRIVPAFAALRGAVARAVDEFAAAEGIDQRTAGQLKREAQAGARLGFRTFLRLHRGDSHDERSIAYWWSAVPDYWEDPVASPEFVALLTKVSRRAA